MITTFEKANKQMVHQFENGAKVVTDFAHSIVYLTNTRGETIDRIDIASLSAQKYTKWIESIGKSMQH